MELLLLKALLKNSLKKGLNCSRVKILKCKIFRVNILKLLHFRVILCTICTKKVVNKTTELFTLDLTAGE